MHLEKNVGDEKKIFMVIWTLKIAAAKNFFFHISFCGWKLESEDVDMKTANNMLLEFSSFHAGKKSKKKKKGFFSVEGAKQFRENKGDFALFWRPLKRVTKQRK